jgi:5-(carboxyamino)imidazole ribonucleotide mutase
MGKTNTKSSKPIVGIIMGSDSDWLIMKAAVDFLLLHEIPCEATVVSAHRTPKQMVAYAENAHKKGIKIIIAGAGGAAHLPGMVASLSPLPIIGVPIKSSNSIDGWDSILSILQMPNGVPVATVALNGAQNAAILALQILGTSDAVIQQKCINYKIQMEKAVLEKSKKIEKLKQ